MTSIKFTDFVCCKSIFRLFILQYIYPYFLILPPLKDHRILEKNGYIYLYRKIYISTISSKRVIWIRDCTIRN